jgi:hypothetical protein
MARALREFLSVSSLSKSLRKERIPPDAPRWHNACNCRCNGKERESSRTLHSISHPVSLASRVASRRVVPGLWRTGRFRPATAPSSSYGDGRTSERVRAARRAADFYRDGQQCGKLSGELEREWNSRRERHGRNGGRGRRLHGSGESPGARFRLRAGREHGGQLQDLGFDGDDHERHFRFGFSRGDPGRTGSHAAVHGHGEFRRQSQSVRAEPWTLPGRTQRRKFPFRRRSFP